MLSFQVYCAMVRTPLALLAFMALSQISRAADQGPAPWDFAAGSSCQPCCDPCKDARRAPPMFGDQFQFGFNFGGGGGFSFGGGGFNFGGGGFNFGGGFQGGFQGGFGAPVAVARGAFKIAENGVARPEDRVFATYNYYNNVLGALDVHREMGGFEKTFAGGDASLEVRLPFVQTQVQNGGAQENDVADLTFILKYAFVNNPDAVLSVGLATTAPTGPIPSVLVVRPDGVDRVHPWQLQPFVGYYRAAGDWYVQGFTSVMTPTDDRDGIWLFNDIGVGYRLFEGDGFVRAVIPTFEAHVNTPLRHRGAVGFLDSVDLTAGAYTQLGERLTLGTAVGMPVTGPRLFDFEAIVSLNWRF